MYIITGHKSFRSATTCTDPDVSYRNYLDTCIFCMGAYGEYSSRLRNFGGLKLVTNLKETKEAKCKLIYSILSKRYTGPLSRRASFSFM